MTGPTVEQINKIRELANQYASIPEHFLLQGLGREPSPDEFLAFIEASIANIFSGGYGMVRETKGPQEGEGWLKHTLGLTSALVRTNGSDAIIKFDVSIKEVPNKLHKKPMLENVQKEMPQVPSAPACQCQFDVSGHCAKCLGILSAYFKGVFPPFMKFTELAKQTQDMCPVCQTMQTDYTMAQILPELLKLAADTNTENRKARSQEILVCVYSIAAMMGAKELPLTDKAYLTAMA
jgi:hypothetical protein